MIYWQYGARFLEGVDSENVFFLPLLSSRATRLRYTFIRKVNGDREMNRCNPLDMLTCYENL